MALGCCVLVWEVGLRLTTTRYQLRGHVHLVEDPVLHHRMLPNATATIRGVTFTTNSLGLKDHAISVDKPPTVFRILMLGDSFTEGYGLSIDQTPAKVVEALLNDRVGCSGRYEVVNAGVGSYSPILEYLLLKRLGLRLSPDLVVLNFDMTDLHDDWIRTRLARLDDQGLPIAVPHDSTRERGLLMLPMSTPPLVRFRMPVERVLSMSAVYQQVRTSRLVQRFGGRAGIGPGMLAALGLVGDIQYDPMAFTRDEEPRRLAEAWTLTERYLAAIATLTASRGIPFVVVVYPWAHQVDATASPGGRLRFDLASRLYPSERPFVLLENFGRRHAVPVVNLLSLFRERARSGAHLFYDDDVHQTPEGAALLARGISAGLTSNGLVPPCRR